MDSTAGASPRQLARIAGALYLINIVAGAFAIGIVPAMLVVSGDAAATANNIQTHELLYRLSLVAHVVVTVTNVPLALIFYELFKADPIRALCRRHSCRRWRTSPTYCRESATASTGCSLALTSSASRT